MRTLAIFIVIFSLAVSVLCPAYGDVKNMGDEKLIGLTISEAMAKLSMKVGKSFVITEPPAVPRGIYGRTDDGDEIMLFIKRGQLPLTFKGGDNFDLYGSLLVIGVKRRKKAVSSCHGEVLWQVACQVPAPPSAGHP